MRTPKYICQRCSISQRRLAVGRNARLSTLIHSRSLQTSHQPWATTAPTRIVTPRTPIKRDDNFWASDVTISSANPDALVRKAQTLGDSVLNSQTIPPERDVLGSLTLIKYAALQLNSEGTGTKTRKDEAREVLSKALAATRGGPVQNLKHDDPQQITTRLLSMLAYKIIKHPPVFISQELLEAYVSAQIALKKLDTIPEIFDLYAHKPVPKKDSSPITYLTTNPKASNVAIPQELANTAIDLAMEQKSLPLALDIISSSFGTPAYRRSRFVRKGLPFLSCLGVSPMVAYSLAVAWAEHSVTLEAAKDAPLATAGIMTYVGVTSGLGWIAMSTYNDQMQRVSWLPGTPLRNRWVREDERAAVDKVAVEFGYRDLQRRGTEEGREWEWLRVWCGERGMRLDAAEQMEGME
jgi:hypothetical protein